MGTSALSTGRLTAGNVLNSDGTGNLAGVGGSSGVQNVGFGKHGAAVLLVLDGVWRALRSRRQARRLAGGNQHRHSGAEHHHQHLGVCDRGILGVATLSIGTSATSIKAGQRDSERVGVGQLTVTPQVGSGGATQVANRLNSEQHAGSDGLREVSGYRRERLTSLLSTYSPPTGLLCASDQETDERLKHWATGGVNEAAEDLVEEPALHLREQGER
jgi:hypothetical protein